MENETASEESLRYVRELLSQSKFQLVLKNVNELLEKFPTHAELLNLQGLSHCGLKQFNEALASFEKLIEIFPNHEEGLSNMAVVHWESGDLDAAESCLKKAINLKPNFVVALNQLGNLYFLKNDFERAKLLLTEVYKVNPGLSRRVLCSTLQALGEFEEAINIISIHANSKSSNEGSEQFKRGIDLSKQGDHEAAVSALTHSLKTDPDNYIIHEHLAVSLIALGKLDQAIETCKNAIHINPLLEKIHFNLGVAYQAKDELELAIQSYPRAIELKPDFNGAHDNVAGIYILQGRLSSALFHYDNIDTKEKILSQKARAISLECLYKLGNFDQFAERLNNLASLDSKNLRAAAVSSFAAHQLKRPDPYPFCRDPLSYLYSTNIRAWLPDGDSFFDNLIIEAEDRNLIWNPPNISTSSGFQSQPDLFPAKTKWLSMLEEKLADEIKKYRTRYKTRYSDFVSFWPAKHKLVGWYVKLVEGGHQTTHIHPTGWLSGVLYLKTLNPTFKDEGAIELGLHGHDLPIMDQNYPRVRHQPIVGDLLLFPSSLFHRTIPVKQSGERCVIAFDLLPIEDRNI